MAAAGRHKTVEVVKHALYVQSQGGATGRYYVQRTLDHLKQCQDYFKEDVKEIRANLPSSANHAFRRFVYENIPQLKYRNQKTLFSCTMTDDSPTELKITFADGNIVDIKTEQKQSEIYNAVVELTKDTSKDVNSKETAEQ